MDIPLNPTGLAQAAAAAEKLRGRGIAAIVSSPLARARDTAMIVGQALGLPVSFEDALREVTYGVREGQPMSDWFTDWIAGNSTPEGAESFAALRARAVAGVNEALTHPVPVLVVAHGALFRALRAEMGLAPDIRMPNATPLFCEPPRGGDAWTLTPA